MRFWDILTALPHAPSIPAHKVPPFSPSVCVLILDRWTGLLPRIKLVRRLNRKIHHVNEVAAAGSINVLKEMVTVRQFAMENEEHRR
eukprot:SAG22_NODE_1257_length_4983_cov_2.902968_6_plen_87_part_00